MLTSTSLPLDPTSLTIAELLPKVQAIQPSLNRPTTSPAVHDFLRTISLKHVLPPAPPINPRKFQVSSSPCNSRLRSISPLTARSGSDTPVVGRRADLAHGARLGRDLRQGPVAARPLERHEHPPVLRQARAAAAEPDHECGLQRGRRDPRAGRRAEAGAAAVVALLCVLAICVLTPCTKNRVFSEPCAA